MLSANREDYIKIVYQMNERKTKLTNKDLASALGVSPASSSEMVKKLIQTKHLSKDKEFGFVLTKLGFDEGAKLIRNHRLWEVFLVNHLDYSWAEVHAEAELLEHVTSMKLGDRLNRYLDHPQYCPHGSLIYGNEGKVDDLVLMVSLIEGDKGTIRKVEDDDEAFLNYLQERGLVVGQSFSVKGVEPFEGSYHIEVQGETHLISYKAVSQIWVRKEVMV